MKTKLLLLVIIFLVISTKCTYPNFYSVFSSDGNLVWAVGESGNVFKSTDGGVSWNSFYLGNTRYYSVFSVNQSVWIVGDSGKVQMSSNNGLNWTQSVLAGGSRLRSVYFYDISNGWIVGDNGTILRTTNGGLNWTAQTFPNGNNLYCIKFQSNNDGIACGANGTVIITQNGGQLWTLSATPVNKNLLSIDRKSSTIISSGADAAVIKSTDNGAAWSIVDYRILTKSDVNSVYMMDANTYYSIGGGGFIRKSTDAGSKFTFQINPMLAELNQIYFYDNNKGWAVSKTQNAVLRTTDGGSNWLLPAGTTASYQWNQKLFVSNAITTSVGFSVSNQNKNVIYASLGNKVFRSGDIGETWTQISTIPFGKVTTSLLVNTKDTSIMIAAMVLFNNTFSGKVMKTTNYGITWTEKYSAGIDQDAMTMEMVPQHPDTIYFIAFDTLGSFFLRSSDFGSTWIPWGNRRFGAVCDIAVDFENPNIIYCGESSYSPKLYKSGDGGLNWVVIDSVRSSQYSEITRISLSNLNLNLILHTWHLNNALGPRISIDKGVSWRQILRGSYSWGSDIAQDDPNVLCLGIYSPFPAYISVDRANSFFTTSVLSGSNIALLFYNRATLLAFQSGEGQLNSSIYKLNINYTVPIGIRPISTELPANFSLSQNYPNPFNPTTKIKFDIPANPELRASNIKLFIYDLLGREIAVLVNEHLKPGTYEVEWNSSSFPSGVYFYRLNAGDYSDTKKMVLFK